MRGKIKLSRYALAWIVLYLSLGAFQHQRAIRHVQQIAKRRQHSPEKHEAKPSFGNIVLWKTIYEDKGKFYIDPVHLLPQALHYEGANNNSYWVTLSRKTRNI